MHARGAVERASADPHTTRGARRRRGKRAATPRPPPRPLPRPSPSLPITRRAAATPWLEKARARTRRTHRNNGAQKRPRATHERDPEELWPGDARAEGDRNLDGCERRRANTRRGATRPPRVLSSGEPGGRARARGAVGRSRTRGERLARTRPFESGGRRPNVISSVAAISRRPAASRTRRRSPRAGARRRRRPREAEGDPTVGAEGVFARTADRAQGRGKGARDVTANCRPGREPEREEANWRPSIPPLARQPQIPRPLPGVLSDRRPTANARAVPPRFEHHLNVADPGATCLARRRRERCRPARRLPTWCPAHARWAQLDRGRRPRRPPRRSLGRPELAANRLDAARRRGAPRSRREKREPNEHDLAPAPPSTDGSADWADAGAGATLKRDSGTSRASRPVARPRPLSEPLLLREARLWVPAAGAAPSVPPPSRSAVGHPRKRKAGGPSPRAQNVVEAAKKRRCEARALTN